METLTIKINHIKALEMLKTLEDLNLIQVIRNSVNGDKKKKLSERLAGSITPEQAKIMHTELAQIRDEWQRNI